MVKHLTSKKSNKPWTTAWCYKWADWMGCKSPGGVRSRAPYGANNNYFIYLGYYLKIKKTFNNFR